MPPELAGAAVVFGLILGVPVAIGVGLWLLYSAFADAEPRTPYDRGDKRNEVDDG